MLHEFQQNSFGEIRVVPLPVDSRSVTAEGGRDPIPPVLAPDRGVAGEHRNRDSAPRNLAGQPFDAEATLVLMNWPGAAGILGFLVRLGQRQWKELAKPHPPGQ